MNQTEEKQYLCIDLKSFYASVECVDRGLDPMTARLVVADPERSEKTICLAVSPAMKKLGVRNRCRVFEIPKQISYITAEPRMQKYIDAAAEIYGIYLRFISPEDIHVYSIDEAFLDVTAYLSLYKTDARGLAGLIMGEILRTTGIPAACGIGTNLYLAKIALDITAKHSPDSIGQLTEQSYRETMWDHTPLTDFWRIGPGICKKLEDRGLYTMGAVARANEEGLYRLFGVDAELLIDHAWGREPVTIADIKAYRSKTACLTSGQVLMRDYAFGEGELIVKEMTDGLCLELADRGEVAGSLTLSVGYAGDARHEPSGGSASLASPTSDPSLLIPAAVTLYRRIVRRGVPIRRVNITCNHVTPDSGAHQLGLFEDPEESERRRRAQSTVLRIKKKYGKNAILKGMNLEDAATGRERNRQIGGHKSGEK